MRTRVIQDEPPEPARHAHRPGLGGRSARYRLVAFFVLAYAFAWCGLPFGLFLAAGPLLAAVVVLAATEGGTGFRDLGARLVRRRVRWYWYPVALGLPLLVSAAGGRPALAWPGVAAAVVLALGTEPGWRGYALPRLQARWSARVAPVLLGVLVAGWHVPLAVRGDLSVAGLCGTAAVAVVACWLFNRTGGSVLLTVLFAVAQGALTRGTWWESAAWALVAAVVFAADRAAWRPTPGGGTVAPSHEIKRATGFAAAVAVLAALLVAPAQACCSPARPTT